MLTSSFPQRVILQDLGGGIVNAIQNGNTSLTITNVSYDLTTIDYFGRVTGGTATGAALRGGTLTVC